MDSLIKVIKVFVNTLMTLILIIGILFIFLYVIGIEPFVVESGSMEPSIHVGSLCFINKHYDYEKINENDVIAFEISSRIKVTHRVINKTEDGLQTKGDANETEDGIITTKDNYIGKSMFSIPKVGFLVKATQTLKGKIVLVTIIIVLLVAALFVGENKKGKRYKETDEKKE